MLDRNVKMPFICPRCEHKSELTVAQIASNPKLTCPNCKAVTQVDASEFKRGLEEAVKAIAKFGHKKTIDLKL